jgi:hypothetical protein
MITLLAKIISKSGCSWSVALVLAMARLATAQTTYTTIPVDQWGAMQVVPSGYAGGVPEAGLIYPFTGSATLPLSVTCQFQPSDYTPTGYEGGYISPGWIELMNDGDTDTDGEAIFQMDKPYGAVWNPAYAQVFIGTEVVPLGADNGTFVPGGLYTIKFTWNRVAATIQIDVTGPTSFSTTASSNGKNIVSLNFVGPDLFSSAPSSSSFGNVSVEVPAPPALPALVLGGWQSFGGTNVMSLTWTNSGVACVLESSGVVTGGWSTVSTPWATNGNWVGIQVTNNNSAQFFRLRGL